MKKECYACSKISVSSEHVPPQSIFPALKDTDDRTDYRKNLITVPSCTDHNLKKSGDDEYFRLILLSNLNLNKEALNLVQNKIFRQLERKPLIALELYNNIKSYVKYNEEVIPIISLDFTRFDNYFKLIVKGLYYHHYGRKYNNSITIYCPTFINDNHEEQEKRNLFSKLLSEGDKHFIKSFHGENEKIFKYSFAELEEKTFYLKTVFYQHIPIYAIIKD